MKTDIPSATRAARFARRCLLHFVLCLAALGIWTLSAPPLATQGDSTLFDPFSNDLFGAVSQPGSPRPAGDDERPGQSHSPVLPASAALPRYAGPAPSVARAQDALSRGRYSNPQEPRAPPPTEGLIA